MRKQFKYSADVGKKSFNGYRAGVQFSTGQAVFNSDEKAEVLEKMGFTVTKLIEDEPKEAPKKPAPRKKAPAKKKGE